MADITIGAGSWRSLAFAVMSTVLLALVVYRKVKDVLWEKRVRNHDGGYRLLRELDRMEQNRNR
jgi:hypothetical protein